MSLALGIATSSLMAQATFFHNNTLSEERTEYTDGNTIQTPPDYPKHKLSDWADRSDKVFQPATWQPLSSNPALYNAVMAKNQQENVGTDELHLQASLDEAGWGTLTNVEDGSLLIYTIEPILSGFVFHDVQEYYKGITFTYYNDSLKPIKEFTLYSNTDTTQQFAIGTEYSSKFFNTDDKLEFTIQAHSFTGGMGLGPTSCRDTVYIINEDGEILGKQGSAQSIILEQIKQGYSTYRHAMVVKSNYTGISDTSHVEVWNARDMIKDGSEAAHVFALANNLTTYTEGASLEVVTVEDETFYVTRYNEKPYVSSEDQLNPTVELDNQYIMELYDPKDFSLVKRIELPIIGLAAGEYHMPSQSYFDEYRLTRHTFNNDDKFEILYGISVYTVSCDCNILYFYLMDEDGNILEEVLPDGLSGMSRLQDLPGQNTQYALWMDNGGGIEAIQMWDIDAQEEIFTFPARHNGDLLTTFYERVPNANGDYEYVFSLSGSEAGENTNYGIIVYYDKEGKETKRVRLDLGQYVASFQPMLNSSSLNPYTFISDDKQEYLYFMKESYPDGSSGTALALAQEDTVLYIWRNKGDLSVAGAGTVPSYDNNSIKYMVINYSDIYYNSLAEFYTLPFDNPQLQGSGTAEDPYIITTPVELDLVRNYPDAYFELGNDIDMSAFTGAGGKGFLGIANFSGHFDGKNHYIKNILINSNGSNAGIFANITGSIQNLSVRNASFTLTGDEMYLGVIAGNMRGTIHNCHVETDMELMTDAKVGGISGDASNSVSQCSFAGNIHLSGEATTGGLVGQLNAKATITNSTSSGSITGKSGEAGGLVGQTMNGAQIQNCYSSMDITAVSYAGGLVGNHRGYVDYAYSSGNITSVADPDAKWPTNMAAGIAATVATGMNSGHVKYSFALNDTIVSPIDYARVANTQIYTMNGIDILDSNYAVNTMMVGPRIDSLYAPGANDTCTKANRKHGQSGTLESFNESFYKANHWAFGQDSLTPWVMNGNMPRLWYEFLVRSVEMPFTETNLEKGSTITLQPIITPADATDKSCRFKSSDVSIASVDANGVVTGNNAGTATITVTTNDGGLTASCLVHVTTPVESIALNQDTVTLARFGTFVLECTVLPENASNQHVLFRSMNENVVYCYGSTLYGVNVGTTKVIATSEDGHASDTCIVDVVIPIEDISLNESSITLNQATPSFQLRATLYPDDATEVPLLWTSDDASVASVSNTGLVKGRAKGSTTVTVSTSDQKVSASCYVTVAEDLANEASIDGILSARFDKGYFVVESSSRIESTQVYSTTGTLVYGNDAVAAEFIRIPAQHLSNGLYLIRVSLENGPATTLKIVK